MRRQRDLILESTSFYRMICCNICCESNQLTRIGPERFLLCWYARLDNAIYQEAACSWQLRSCTRYAIWRAHILGHRQSAYGMYVLLYIAAWNKCVARQSSRPLTDPGVTQKGSVPLGVPVVFTLEVGCLLRARGITLSL